jgi:pilus assembly protein CpaB
MARRPGALVVSGDAARSVDDSVGLTVGYTVGEAVLGTIHRGQQLVSQQLGQGVRTAISVELIDPERVADSCEPGAWVAVFVSEDPEPHLADGSTHKLPPLTRILLPKVQVLVVGGPTDDDADASDAPRITLTIAVTQAEAEKVICGSRNGDLTFALRSDRSAVVSRPFAVGREIAPEFYGSAS